jgi:hypothetical protein
MLWFGKSWEAPCCDPVDHVDTPSGLCAWCELPIRPTDQGFVLHGLRERELWHLDCLAVNIGVMPITKEPPRTTGVAEAIATAIRIQNDPTNRSVTCPCGAVFLSGAARKDDRGRPICIGCGTAVGNS